MVDCGTFFAVLTQRPPLVPPGDIAALQNMPLKTLYLFGSEELTGKRAVRVGRISKVLPQGNIKGQAPLNHVQPPDPLPSHIGVNKAKLQQMFPNCKIYV